MERIGREVERELARGGSRDAIPLAALTAAWPEVVGDAIARQAWPLRIARDGTLHVATSSATWANELGFLAGEIVERLRARLGPDAPTRLRCAVGPVPESRRGRATRRPWDRLRRSPPRSARRPIQRPRRSTIRSSASWSREPPERAF